VRKPAAGVLEVEVRPPWPYRIPRRGAPDGVLRARDGVLTRFIHAHGEPVVVHAWQRRDGTVAFRAVAAADEVDRAALELAIERMRFALGVNEDFSDLFAKFKRDPVLGPALRRRPWSRPRRRPWPWEALAWAITSQLIEASRAAAIQRRLVRSWGGRLEWTGHGGPLLREVPTAAEIADRAPAELAAADLSPGRALAMIACAREVATGRVEPADPDGDRRLLAIREIGPWTMQCLGFAGRGDPDSLPAGDLAYVKLVGRMAGLRRRATVEEVEDYFERFAPYRGLAGHFMLLQYHLAIPAGPPLRLAA
jgi:3-methyladenine DNA glycosylase/8-oxoguanine DNA glycosylase